MGSQCPTCCPFSRGRKRSEDSLSRASNPAVLDDLDLESQKPSKAKKSPKKEKIEVQLKTLQKQESAFFHKNNLLKLQEKTVPSKLIPLITPRNRESINLTKAENEDHSSYYSRIKSRIKPQINKISTMDEQDSVHGGQFVKMVYLTDGRSSEMEPSEAESEADEAGEIKNNKTFNGNDYTMMLIKQFRSLNERVNTEPNKTEQIEALKQKLNEAETSNQELSSIHFQIGKCYFDEQKLFESKKHLEESLRLMFQGEEKLKCQFESCVYSLLGCISFLNDQTQNAIDLNLKALKLEAPNTESVKLIEINYWLGECYLKLDKISLARDYFLKSLKGYHKHSLKDSSLLQNTYLNLGKVYHKEGEYAEADKYYHKGIKISQQIDKNHKYFETLLRLAQNFFAMDNYRQSIITFSRNFRAMRKHNLSNLPIFQQAQSSLSKVLKAIADSKISENQLSSIIKTVESIFPEQSELKLLKQRLRKMRAILYK